MLKIDSLGIYIVFDIKTMKVKTFYSSILYLFSKEIDKFYTRLKMDSFATLMACHSIFFLKVNRTNPSD